MSSIDHITDVLTNFLLDPKNRPLLAILKGLRNGIVYGIKIRFPHALIMTFLFRSGPLKAKFGGIFKLTFQHARNLGVFVTIYKTLMYLQRSSRGGREERLDSFLAGLVGGCYIFGNDSAVVQQMNLYVFARVMQGLAKLAIQKGVVKDSRGTVVKYSWPVFGSLTWAAVMYMFRWHPEVIQPSMRSSMKYLYVNSDNWDSWRNYLWHNT